MTDTARPYTDADVELVAHALADACPTPDQCADTHDECVRRHGIHWLSVGPGGLGEQHITAVEGSPRAIASIALAALTAAGRLVPGNASIPDTLRGLLEDLTDEDPCWFDHHGYCQAHGWMATEPRCPQARAKELLAADKAEEQQP